MNLDRPIPDWLILLAIPAVVAVIYWGGQWSPGLMLLLLAWGVLHSLMTLNPKEERRKTIQKGFREEDWL